MRVLSNEVVIFEITSLFKNKTKTEIYTTFDPIHNLKKKNLRS